MSGQSNPNAPTLRLGTRGSTLARAQSQLIIDSLLRQHRPVNIETQIFKTSGDQIADRPLHELGGKGLFVRELEQALLDKKVDLVVHSFKDVPVTMPLVDQSNLIITAVPQREDVHDVLISTSAKSIADLPPNAKIGTGSLRRKCQLLALRPDLQIENIRGNIDTRIHKQRDGEFDAIILALAGLKRANLFDPSTMHPIPLDDFLPDAGQGALALQCRRDDSRTQQFLAPLDDPFSRVCVSLERHIVLLLNGDCFSPIAALAELIGTGLRLRVAVGRRGGELPILRGQAQAPLSGASATIIKTVLNQLSDQNVHSHLHG
ncbi:MAG TPA: hydroxymethylbilane synthase [Tepidisphaeraceae bacterium]|nr:hydroxymethylbilane synthase [Tepidisphaeraceae bacterium]